MKPFRAQISRQPQSLMTREGVTLWRQQPPPTNLRSRTHLWPNTSIGCIVERSKRFINKRNRLIGCRNQSLWISQSTRLIRHHTLEASVGGHRIQSDLSTETLGLSRPADNDRSQTTLRQRRLLPTIQRRPKPPKLRKIVTCHIQMECNNRWVAWLLKRTRYLFFFDCFWWML